MVRSRFKKLTTKVVFFLFALVATLVSYQNCSSPNFNFTEAQDSSTLDTPTLFCSFNGKNIDEGQSVLAYLSSSVPYGQQCQSENRICQEGGVLSGSYNFATCGVGVAASCIFNGKTIAHGESVIGYADSSVPYGQQCQTQSRICNNGVLQGNYAYSSCSVGGPRSCLFNGQMITHGQSINAYATSSVPYGSTCEKQSRMCLDGTLSGSFQHALCVVAPPYCSDLYLQPICEAYEYLFGRWPEEAGAKFWADTLTTNKVPTECWIRQIAPGAQSTDCERHKAKFGFYPLNGAYCPKSPVGEAPRAKATATCK